MCGVGAWIDAKPGDEVCFTPGAVEVRCSPAVVGTRMMDGRPVNVDPKDAADLWGRIIAERASNANCRFQRPRPNVCRSSAA